jgi:hypothetical protein
MGRPKGSKLGRPQATQDEGLSFIRQVVDLYQKASDAFTADDLFAVFGETYHKGSIQSWLSSWAGDRYRSDQFRNAMGPRVLVRVKNGVYKFVDNEAAAIQYKSHRPGKMTKKPGIPDFPVTTRNVNEPGVQAILDVNPVTAAMLESVKPNPVMPVLAKTRFCMYCRRTVTALGPHNCEPIVPGVSPQTPEEAATDTEENAMPPVQSDEKPVDTTVQILHSQVIEASNDRTEVTYLLKIGDVLYKTVPFSL